MPRRNGIQSPMDEYAKPVMDEPCWFTSGGFRSEHKYLFGLTTETLRHRDFLSSVSQCLRGSNLVILIQRGPCCSLPTVRQELDSQAGIGRSVSLISRLCRLPRDF